MQIPEYILALFQLKAEYLNKLKLLDKKINAWMKTQQGGDNNDEIHTD